MDLLKHLQALPQGSTVSWYIPTAAPEGVLTPESCDLYLVVGPHESRPAWTLLDPPTLASYQEEAREEEHRPPDAWDPRNPSRTALPLGDLLTLVVPCDTLLPDGTPTWSALEVSRVLQAWSAAVVERSDLTFEYLEEWETKDDPAWASLHEALNTPAEDLITFAPGVQVTPALLDQLLAMEDEERVEASRAISDLSGIVFLLREDAAKEAEEE